MPAIQAHHARVDMAAKPSTHGAMNTSTPMTTAAHSAKRFDGLDRFQRPARNSNAPPMYAVHANGACDVLWLCNTQFGHAMPFFMGARTSLGHQAIKDCAQHALDKALVGFGVWRLANE